MSEGVLGAGINVYSFGLKPEEHQPSGTINMSRIDSAILQLKLKSDISSPSDATVKIFASSFNVLKSTIRDGRTCIILI